MVIFSGRYSWDGKKSDYREPISWFPGAYDITIARIAEKSSKLVFIRPYMCVYTNTGSGYSVSANPEKFAKRICEDFHLKMEKVLWVEQLSPDGDDFEVVVFHQKGRMGNTVFYDMEKRPARPNEISRILQHLPHGSDIRQESDRVRG